ncbi:MAG TPA: YceI family protein [Candidatus Udaeobacter sp.]|nr:YceI family protein [Candidatus Udaeobacter sp.]
MAVSTDLVRVVNGRWVPIAGVWEFDPGHTEVSFEGRHLMVSRVRGRFTSFSGRLVVGEVPEQSTAELSIQAASVESGFQDRDDHLKSADWFDVDRHPAITFRSGILAHISGSHWKAQGVLAVKGVERPIELDVEFLGGVTDPWGTPKIGALIKGEVDREAWGLTWNVPLDSGGLVVGQKVALIVTVEAVFRGARP